MRPSPPSATLNSLLRSKRIILIILIGFVVTASSLWYFKDTSKSLSSPTEVTIGEEAVHRSIATHLEPELVSHVLHDKHKAAFLNPCWSDQAQSGSSGFSCLPHFYVSGFHSGAINLANRLAGHPSIVLDAGKGPTWNSTHGFWSESDATTMQSYLDLIQRDGIPRLIQAPETSVIMDGSVSTLDLSWAGSGRAHRAFRAADEACRTRCLARFGGSFGEPYEQCSALECLLEAKAADERVATEAGLPYTDLQLPLLIRAVYRNQAQPKFVFLLRHPIHRIYSAYFGTPTLTERYGQSLGGFTQFVGEQYGGYRRCLSNHSETECIMRFETLGAEERNVFSHCEQILRGMYSTYLRTWFKFFPRSSFLIINSQDLFQQQNGDVTAQILKFLGLSVPPLGSPVWAAMEASAGPRITNTEQVGWVIPEGARRVLSRLYERHNSDLADLLGDERWLLWNDDARFCPPSCI